MTLMTPMTQHPHITSDTIRQLARLAGLHLDDSQVDILVGDLLSVLRYLDILQQVHIDEPDKAAEHSMGLRKDVLSRRLSRHDILQQSGRSVSNGFVVPPCHGTE